MPKPVTPRKSVKNPASGSNPLRKASRPTLVRWIHILDSLRSDKPPIGYMEKTTDWTPNEVQFAKALDCSHRTIVRDIQALRQCGYKIDYDEQEYRLEWINKTSVEPLPLMAATEDEVISLITALTISKSVLDAGTAENLRTFLLKLEQHLDDGFLHPFEDIEKTVQFKHVFSTPKDTTLWTRLQRFILDQNGVELEYASPHEGNEPYTLRVLPLLLNNLEGIWYLHVLKLSADQTIERDSFRILRLNRIRKVRKIRFQVPEDWDRNAVLKRIESGVGAWQGGEEERVLLRIAKGKIGFMRERAWYPGHTFTEADDGSWLLAFKASQVEHLVPFVLQWGPDIEVLDPAYLREEVAWTARAVVAQHTDD